MLIYTGLGLGIVLELSFDQFRSLYDSCERLDATEKRLNAWTMMVATQASGKDMKKFSKMWDAIIDGRDDDAAAFLNKHPGGL